jgi:hypothetical protein
MCHWLAKTQAVKGAPKPMHRPPPLRLAELLDQAFIQSNEASLDEDDPPCASEKAWKGCRPDEYRISYRLCDTSSRAVSSLETLVSTYDSGSSPPSLTSILVVSRSALEGQEPQDHDLEDFRILFFIPSYQTARPARLWHLGSELQAPGSAWRAQMRRLQLVSAPCLLAMTRIIEATDATSAY